MKLFITSFVIYLIGLLIVLAPVYAWDPLCPLADKGQTDQERTAAFKAAKRSRVTVPGETNYPNIRINSDTSLELQNEQSVAVNPRDPDNVVAVWRDFRLGYRQVGVGYSMDGGSTWIDTLFQGTPYTFDSDPWLTVDSSGTFYCVVLGFESTSQPNGFFVFRSSDGGVQWDGPFTVIDGVPGVFEDKEVIMVDRTGSPYDGNLYVAWARFYDTQVLLTRSMTGGTSWTKPVRVDDFNCFQWPVCSIGVNGEVYITWISYSGIAFDRSFDGGSSFGKDIPVVSTSLFTTLNGGIDVFTFPATTVDISMSLWRGSIYIAYADWAGTDMDIYFVFSRDGGTTWSSPQRINDDTQGLGRDQFHPWIFVDDSGNISVIWLDRRLDPANLLMDCYLARSTDGGITWSTNERITTVSSDPTAGQKAGLLGEYIGLSGTTNRLNPVWTDTRNGHQDAYTAPIPLSSGDVPILGKTAVIIILTGISIAIVITRRKIKA